MTATGRAAFPRRVTAMIDERDYETLREQDTTHSYVRTRRSPSPMAFHRSDGFTNACSVPDFVGVWRFQSHRQ